MKTKSFAYLAGIFSISISAVIGQSKFSGIYAGKFSTGVKYLAAATAGGRLLGLDNKAYGLGEAIDPAKSTVNASGKINAATSSGAVIVATISSDFRIAGTIKQNGKTARITGQRIFK